MGNTQVSSDVAQRFFNNVTEANQQNCQATTNTVQSGNTVIVKRSRIDGSKVGVTTQNSTDATCLIVSDMADNVSNILKSVLSQTVKLETSIFSGGGNVDAAADIAQSVVNNINQINEATCSASSITSQVGNYVYVNDSSIKDSFVGVSSASSPNANCTMDNYMKNTIYNAALATTTQDVTKKGIIAAIVGAFAGIIALVVILAVVLLAVGALGFVGYEAVERGKGTGAKTPAAAAAGAGAQPAPPSAASAALSSYYPYSSYLSPSYYYYRG